MEVTPFLEPGDKAAAGMWYIISPEGVSPCERVGHACLTLNRSTEKKGEGEPEQLELANETVVVVAGATPSGPFEDVYYLKLCEFVWMKMFLTMFTYLFSINSRLSFICRDVGSILDWFQFPENMKQGAF